MKIILYIVAIVALLGGSAYSYKSMKAFDDLKNTRVALDGENENRKAKIKTAKKEAKDMEAQLKAARGKLDDAEAGRENAKSNLKLSKKEAGNWKSKIAGQQEKLDENKDLITQIEEAFKGLGAVDLKQIPELVQKLEDDLKGANKKLEELNALTAAAKTRVATNSEQIQTLDARIAKRASRIQGNSAQGRITAVNHDWGFVTVDIPSIMPVDSSAKLMIKRGSTYIGNLNINAIEGSRIVADIDYKSMTPGLVVQPGDHVILAKPVTN